MSRSSVFERVAEAFQGEKPLAARKTAEPANAPAVDPAAQSASFETQLLENYYSQVLAQSRVSFWFSLGFASIGFFIIVFAALTHSESEQGATIARFIAGVVVDAVAALFFVQSKQAQRSMGEFFDKLRRDRNHVEARRLCESLTTSAARDALRIRLSLHYCEVESAEETARFIYGAELPREVSKDQ